MNGPFADWKDDTEQYTLQQEIDRLEGDENEVYACAMEVFQTQAGYYDWLLGLCKTEHEKEYGLLLPQEVKKCMVRKARKNLGLS